MSNFNIHTKETAQTESAELLGNAEKAFGFIPNLLGVFAESPAALTAAIVWSFRCWRSSLMGAL